MDTYLDQSLCWPAPFCVSALAVTSENADWHLLTPEPALAGYLHAGGGMCRRELAQKTISYQLSKFCKVVQGWL